MRKYIAIVGIFAAIALTTTGFAGQNAAAGPPETVNLHDYDVVVVETPALKLEPKTFSLSYLAGKELTRSFALAPDLFYLDRRPPQFRELILVYDFNYWREQIKPLLALNFVNTEQRYKS